MFGGEKDDTKGERNVRCYIMRSFRICILYSERQGRILSIYPQSGDADFLSRNEDHLFWE
jgi:hypothetical protein